MSEIRKVGVKYPPKNKPYDKPLSYKDVFCDEDGWVDANRYLPADYDLMFLKVEGKKTQSGWWSGVCWDGLNLKSDDKVLYWKRNLEDQLEF